MNGRSIVGMGVCPLALLTVWLPLQGEAGPARAGRKAAAQAKAEAASQPPGKAASQPASAEAARARRKANMGPRAKAPTANANFKPRSIKDADGKTLDYWLMTPKDYDPKQKYPLLVALHGSQGVTQAANTLGADDMREKHRWFVMAPKAPDGSGWASSRMSRERLGERPVCLPQVFAAIDALEKEYSIDSQRLYVTGQSMGGMGTYGAIAAHPEMFAAAAPVCGGWDLGDAPKFARVPIWIFHGGADPLVPVSYSRDMVEALKKAGASPRYTEFPGVEHNSWVNAYAMPELWDWMGAQKLNAPATAPAQNTESHAEK